MGAVEPRPEEVDYGAPRLSVVMVAGGRRGRAQRTLDALAAQECDGLEVIVADLGGADAADLSPPPGCALTVVRCPGGTAWGAARARGLVRARAPVVAFIEDHCTPDPGWAAALLEAHRGPWAAVGYAFRNANPGTYLSFASFFFDYGIWAAPVPGGPAPLVAYNNVSYKAHILASLPGGLEDLLETDFHLHGELRRRGEGLFVAGRAVAAHENYTRLAPLLAANHHYCRVLAAGRARLGGWGRPKRLFYGAATPLAGPLVSLFRRARSLGGRRSLALPMLASLPVVVLAACAAAAGESLGYLFGAGESPRALVHWEVHAVRDGG